MKLSDLPGLESLLYETVCKLNLTGQPWVLGGSCSLLLQGVQLDKPPRDIDIYTDAESVHELHASLADWAEDAPHLDQEGMYASILSHYGRYGVSIELVGGFTVMTGDPNIVWKSVRCCIMRRRSIGFRARLSV